MEKNYIELFKDRKWYEAFDAVPLNKTKIIELDPKDFVIIRVRASDYNSKNEAKQISITIDYETHLVAITAKRKEDGTTV